MPTAKLRRQAAGRAKFSGNFYRKRPHFSPGDKLADRSHRISPCRGFCFLLGAARRFVNTATFPSIVHPHPRPSASVVRFGPVLPLKPIRP
jgi:hypothetical protein